MTQWRRARQFTATRGATFIRELNQLPRRPPAVAESPAHKTLVTFSSNSRHILSLSFSASCSILVSPLFAFSLRAPYSPTLSLSCLLPVLLRLILLLLLLLLLFFPLFRSFFITQPHNGLDDERSWRESWLVVDRFLSRFSIMKTFFLCLLRRKKDEVKVNKVPVWRMYRRLCYMPLDHCNRMYNCEREK